MNLLCWFGIHKKGETVSHSPTEKHIAYACALGATRILSRLTHRCARCGNEFGKRGFIYQRGDKWILGEIEK